MKQDLERAKGLFQRSSAAVDSWSLRDEAARDRYALGLLIGGEEGQAMMRDALAVMSEAGFVAPLSNLRAYIPELLRPAATR